MDGLHAATHPAMPPWITRAVSRTAAPLDVPPAPCNDADPIRSTGGTAKFLRRDLSEAALLQPAAPVYSVAELQAAQDASFEAGHAAGMVEAEASRANNETIALAAVAGLLAGARQTVAAVADEAALALAKAMIGAMAIAMPALMEAAALGEVEAMIARILPGLTREPAIRIEVAPEMAAGVAQFLARLEDGDREAITVAGVPSIGAGGARVVWSAGQARRQPQQLWDGVAEILQAALADQQMQRMDHAG